MVDSVVESVAESVVVASVAAESDDPHPASTNPDDASTSSVAAVTMSDRVREVENIETSWTFRVNVERFAVKTL